MYTFKLPKKTNYRINKSIEGETIESKVRRITSNGEPITDGAPILYTERKDGVLAEYDIRTDRFDLAIDAMDSLNRAHIAKRNERHNPKKEDGGTPSIGETSVKTS